MFHFALIFAAFAFIHSITVSKTFKDACRYLLGATFMRVFYRALYCIVSAVTAAIAFSFIHHAPDRQIWTAPQGLRWLMHGIQLVGLVFGSLAFRYLDAWEFVGAKQLWRYFTRHEVAGNIEGLTHKDLVTRGVYGIVRHPLYLAGLVLFTFNPLLTINSLTVTIFADAYFLYGMFIEEKRFLMIFGVQYREYRKRVPMFIPRLGRRRRGRAREA